MARQMDLDFTGLSFTRQWFRNRNLAEFRDLVAPQWAGKQMNYLELGVFEGMSMCWMLQHVLTHPEAFAVGVDPWLPTTKLDGPTMEMVMQRALANTEIWGHCQLIRGNSAEILRRMVGKGFAGIVKGSVDLCMVDGNHNSLAVLDDCRLVFKLLKVNGWMLLDDVVNDIPKGPDHVEAGLRMFLKEFGDKMEMVWKRKYMECWRKTSI